MLPDIIRAARALAGMSQTDLAVRAELSRSTINDFERGARTPHANHIAAIRRALEDAGVEFIDANGSGPGVRLKKPST